MYYFIAAVVLLLCSAALAPFYRAESFFRDRLSLTFGLSGTLCGLAATVFCLIHPEAAGINIPWPSLSGRLVLHLDPLSAVFLLPAFFITGTGLLYGNGYWPTAKKPASSSWIRFFYPLLAAGIALLLTAGNGVLFLFGWEIMAMAGYFLVVTERHDDEAHRAGYIYLVATHTGTLALFAVFALLGGSACLLQFPEAASLTVAPRTANCIFLLALFGFGCKAGIIPLHVWLPRAHAATPSHVSALMSGVMIKAGIYGILRITSFFATIQPWWGWLVLILGVISGILGVLFAICQHDIKRLLAYHSVENIGIILIGTGVALLGRIHGLEAVTALGLGGALLHVINHGLFKGLLFLSAGSVIHATGSRQMSDYGGLLPFMPLTAAFFLGGSIAICGLPPLNGFISEWLVYLGLLQGGLNSSGMLSGCLLAVVSLAIIGGLALLCFTKVFGLSFLGLKRTTKSDIIEAPSSMLAGMTLLLAACLWIGLLPMTALPLLDKAVAAWLGKAAGSSLILQVMAPAGAVSLWAFALAALCGLLLMINKTKKASGMPRQPTWGCGYFKGLQRAQYTTSSFAEIIIKLFNWTLWTKIERERPAALLPDSASLHTQTPDPILDRIVIPGFSMIVEKAGSIRRIIQHGQLGIYLLYTALTLCLLLLLTF